MFLKWLFISIVLPSPKCHVVGIIQCVGFSDWPLSLSDTHVTPLPVFSWLDGSFLLSTEPVPLSGWDHTLSLHLLKAILVTSKF